MKLILVAGCWLLFVALLAGGVFMCFNGPRWLGVASLLLAIGWMLIAGRDRTNWGI